MGANKITGEQLRDLCISKGVQFDYGVLTNEQQSRWWDSEALIYKTAEEFLEGHNISLGGTDTVHAEISGDYIFDTEYTDDSVFTILTNSEQPLQEFGVKPRVTCEITETYSYLSLAFIYGYGDSGTLVLLDKTVNIGTVSVYGYHPDLEGTVTYFVSILDETTIEFRYRGDYSYTDIESGQPTKLTGGFPESGFHTKTVPLPFSIVSFESDIIITYDPGGGGGGGGGGGSVLKFTAESGLSGRHADPLHGLSVTRPIARSERPPYGSGGFGGHGGGGGAGASTTVVRKFTSGKADSVEVNALVKRHGYGSGGGQGGQGGDGCILVFW